jgi:hypothetical protein
VINIRSIIRRNKIDNLLGISTLNEEEKELLSFLEDTFNVFESGRWIRSNDSNTYIYNDKILFYSNKILKKIYNIYGVDIERNDVDIDTNDIVKNYFEARFNVKIEKCNYLKFAKPL